ncbi:hypothetical protein VIN01S_14700 [Vibrio inusitatus NBRC 102082]|uniref:Glycosyltransferase RgtA/B/C/D-like domain-containing protein n=1 Tax=Vibrio inusitatus NBRC 102082 TaxID=1219070 RepID=A0A4Y3HUA5_9VIBR|nr:hypothetical protein [Vibrio inusitatus]GEA50666.1 hypothetical protein VIN01S_14700 [Vibrio inusitatus NBRC 102082]
MSNYFKVFLSLTIWVSLFISAYIFSRFTVDDAFISWRYGYNLVHSGYFNYNPTNLDLTQAYTNPIYALMSIFPAILNIDVVVFFKVISLLMCMFFVVYLYRKHGVKYGAIIFMAIPATMLHISSGLETFLFTILLIVLYDCLRDKNIKLSIVVVSLLFLVRPESFILSILVPIYYMTEKEGSANPFVKIKSIFRSKNIKNYYPLVLVIILFLILSLHNLYFGSWLPNTFYIKSVNNEVVTSKAIDFFIWCIPALFFTLFLIKNENTSLFYVFFFLFLAMSINYSMSTLQMDYASRFFFHIYSPLYFILLIESKHSKVVGNKERSNALFDVNCFSLLCLSVFMVFFYIQCKPAELRSLSEYYPRLKTSHAQIGYSIQDSGAKSMVFSDAGVAAFNSEINALDNIGLGSTMVAKYGVNDRVLNAYNPSIVVFKSRPATGIRLKENYQTEIYKWVEENELIQVCQVYFNSSYSMLVYAKPNLNITKLQDVCKKSNYNLNGSDEVFKNYLLVPPWHFWNNDRLI